MKMMKTLLLLLVLSVLSGCVDGDGNGYEGFGIKPPTDTGGAQGGNNGNPSANLVSIVSGNNQSVATGGQASLPLVILVLQSPGQPVANETVYFSVIGGNSKGSLSYSSAVTNASGYAQVDFTAGSFIGDVNIVASAPQGSVNFMMNVTGFTGYQLEKTAINSGDTQNASVGSSLPNRFRVQLTDSHDNPVAGQSIRFFANSTPIGNFAGINYYDTFTDHQGIAESLPFTLNTLAGVHSVNAYVLSDSSVHTIFTATALTPSNSSIHAENSILKISPGVVAANNINVVEATLEVRDQFGNLIPNNTYGPSISVGASPSLYNSTWIGSWTYTNPGIYKRNLLVGNTSGLVTLSTVVSGVALTSENPVLSLTAESTFAPQNTTITSSVSTLAANGTSTTTIVVTLRDQFGNAIALSAQTISITTTGGTLLGSMDYHPATQTYRQVLRSPTSAAAGNIQVTLDAINGIPLSPVKTVNILLESVLLSAEHSTLTAPSRSFANSVVPRPMYVQLNDINGNPITASGTVYLTLTQVSGTAMGGFLPGIVPNIQATPMGNGLYIVNYQDPGGNVLQVMEINGTAQVGATTINLRPMRVMRHQYVFTDATPSTSYLVMPTTTASALAGNTLVGTIYLGASIIGTLPIGGFGHKISADFTGCTPPYTITENVNGTYTLRIQSTGTACSGSMTLKYNGTNIRTGSVSSAAAPNPVSFNFYGEPSLAQSLLTLDPEIMSGSAQSTVTLELKDENGINFSSCAAIPASKIRFIESHVDLSLLGSVSCSDTTGKAFYSQIIDRSTNPGIYSTASISAQQDIAGSWSTFNSTKILTMTPPNLAGNTIDCANQTSFRDKDIYIANGTLTINGWLNGGVPTLGSCSPGNPIRFKSVRVGPGGIITHSPATTTNAYGVEFEATEEVEIENGGKIDVSEKGYLGGKATGQLGRGPGNIANVLSVGSYGGIGTKAAGNTPDTNTLSVRQAPYGNAANPNDLGSGSAYWSNNPSLGGNGGGLIRIKAPSMTLNGSLLANGQSTGVLIPGAGGGIKIDLNSTGKLLGTGIILANGGAITSGAAIFGGGGRIAVIGDMTDFTGPTPLALSGHGLRDQAVSNYGHHLGHGSLYIIKVPSLMTAPWTFMNLGNGSQDSHLGNLNSLVIPSGQTLAITSATSLGEAQVNGELILKGNLTIDDLTINNLLTFENSGKVTADQLTINGTITHMALTQTNGNPKIDILARNIHTGPSSIINAAGKGYPATFGLNFAVTAARNNYYSYDGGNHFTRGGAISGGLNNALTWGSPTGPNTYGGGSYDAPGGGIVRLIASNEIVIRGSIDASGANLPTEGAGAAGGSIYVESPTLTFEPTASVNAKGANSSTVTGSYNRGGGAGGLVTLKYTTFNGNDNQVNISGGLSYEVGIFVPVQDGVFTKTIVP